MFGQYLNDPSLADGQQPALDETEDERPAAILPIVDFSLPLLTVAISGSEATGHFRARQHKHAVLSGKYV